MNLKKKKKKKKRFHSMIFKIAVNFKMAVKQLILTVVEVSLNETRKAIELKLLLCQKETAII